MLLVELPGPRILIFVKAQLLTKKPDTKGPVESLGILGVVDLNLELAKITIGIALNQEIKDLIKLKVPVEALFTTSARVFTMRWEAVRVRARVLALAR